MKRIVAKVRVGIQALIKMGIAHGREEVGVTDYSCPTPRIIPRSGPEGPRGYLAVSPTDAPIQIGVVGDTEDEVRAHFEQAWARWVDLRLARTQKAGSGT
jgi:hypothetical protein